MLMTNLEAKLDGFRVYKIKNRGDIAPNGRAYTGPVYVEGLPGDVALLNMELKDETTGTDDSSK